MDWVGSMLRWVIEPPFRMKVKTTPPFEPKNPKAPAAVIEEFMAGQSELARRVNNADGRDLDAIRIASPFNSRMTYNLYAAFRILTAHQRRHLWQLEQVLQLLTRH
jgi:hypothetical protein